MGITVSEPRPTVFSNWGDDNPTPLTDVVEPPSGLQESGWLPSQKPPAPYMNWLHYIEQRWVKNLDVRAPRIPTMKWFVGAQSGAHFATLAAALASGSVGNGDWIYFSPSNANAFLDTAITVNKSVKIFCEPYTLFYKGTGPTRAFIITADFVELHGAGFASNWSGGSDIAIEITGGYCRIVGCSFDSNITEFINDTACLSGEAPILSQNYVEY